LDLTLPTPAENLALDEALLDEAEAAGRPTETLRIWEPPVPVVVVGRSSKIAAEVNVDACRCRGIPILRRTSGGAAVVTGPGCLMYALILSYQMRPALRAVDAAHQFVLSTIARALGASVPGVAWRGISDLAFAPRGLKFSGNSMRLKHDHLLYHGTLLYDFPLGLIEECLAMPPREPDYRDGRPHGSFVANLPLAPAAIRDALISAWDAREPCPDWPRGLTAQLAADRYSRQEWNEGHSGLSTLDSRPAPPAGVKRSGGLGRIGKDTR
jgi:lipoate-protein ligase A